MSINHQEYLATYEDSGPVHSYGYGCLRELCKQFSDGNLDQEQFTNRWHAVVAAVEFRIAELKADLLGAKLQLANRRVHVLPEAPETSSAGIYVSDENADERPNNE